MRDADQRPVTPPQDPDLTDLGLALTIATVLLTARIVVEQTRLGARGVTSAFDGIGHDVVGLILLGTTCLWSICVIFLQFRRRRVLSALDGCLFGSLALCAALGAIPGEDWRLLRAHVHGTGPMPNDWIVRTAARGEVRLLDFLLSHGGNADARWDGQTALGVAAAQGDLRTCELLIARGAFIDIRTTMSRETPLLEAAAEGHLEVVAQLLAQGADPTARDFGGLAAQDWAVQRGDAKVLQMLDQSRSARESGAASHPKREAPKHSETSAQYSFTPR